MSFLPLLLLKKKKTKIPTQTSDEDSSLLLLLQLDFFFKLNSFIELGFIFSVKCQEEIDTYFSTVTGERLGNLNVRPLFLIFPPGF